MQTRLVALILGNPHPDTMFFWVTICFHGLLNDRLRSLAHLQKPSIEPLHMRLLRQFGFGSFWLSYIAPSSRRPLYIVIIFLRFTCPAIQSSIGGQSILRSTFTSFGRKWHWGKFEFFMSRLQHSLRTSSPKAYRLSPFKIFVSVST
jgi:hypothetical protein